MGKVTKKTMDCHAEEKNHSSQNHSSGSESDVYKSIKQTTSKQRPGTPTKPYKAGTPVKNQKSEKKLAEASKKKTRDAMKTRADSEGKVKDPEIVIMNEVVLQSHVQEGTNGSVTMKNSNSQPEEILKNGTENGTVTKENGNRDLQENEEVSLHLEAEENGEVPQNDMQPAESSIIDVEAIPDEVMSQETNSQPKEAETCSVDVVGSTTPEISVTVEESAPLTQKTNENDPEAQTDDLVSYGSNITLKNVQIKLSDCLKDKNGENSEMENGMENSQKDLSFGGHLRKISGRRSLHRMRNITFRDRQPSLESSLFVNTSSSSLAQDETDFKILHHRSGAYTPLNNGMTASPSRKRKMNIETLDSNKKPKSDAEQSMLNSSFDFIKGLRGRVQVSTPCKIQSEKLNLAGDILKNELPNETGAARSWCTLM